MTPPLLLAVGDIRPVDPGDASDHRGLVATSDVGKVDADELTWI